MTTPQPPQPQPKQGPTSNDYLREIAAHLKSIRSMLSFFTLLLILSMIIGACNVLLSV